MIRFDSDYLEGAHELIIRKLTETNLEQTPGYGEDQHCRHACDLIRKACGRPDADVHLLVGGTQTNATVISSALKPYQGVVCAQSAHINVHETGAIEHGGHKVIALPHKDAKITAEQVDECISSHFADATAEHMVQPGMVYISFPTELGTLYTLQELTEISSVCHNHDIPLFVDGARMGYGLTGIGNDVSLQDIARLADVFYIGGTKVGALFGEAVVICSDALKKDFRYNIKQGGGMLAKGRLLGIQFETLFENGLYLEIAGHAIEMAVKLKKIFSQRGFGFLVDSPTNQQFPIIPDTMAAKLAEEFGFELWQRCDGGRSAVRFCTSWCTPQANIDALEKALDKLN